MVRYIVLALATVLTLVAGTARGQYTDSQVLEAQGVFNQLVEGALNRQCPRVVGSGVFNRQDSTLGYGDVILYSDCRPYSPSVRKGVGSYDVRDMGIGDNTLSKIVIPQGFKVTLYPEPGFQKNSEIDPLYLTETVECLDTTKTVFDSQEIQGWNKVTSSIKIERIDPNKVVLYEDCRYQGSSVALPPGSYDYTYLADALGVDEEGDPIDWTLESIIIPAGWQVELFSEPGFSGPSLTLDDTGPIRCLTRFEHPWHGDWRGGTNSLIISGPTNQVALYPDCMLGGIASYWAPGAYDNGSPGFLDDQASSISIPQGTAVTLYEDSGFAGHRATLRSTTMCLEDLGWNDAISSFKISDGKISWKEIWCYMESRGVIRDEVAAKNLTEKLDSDASGRIDLQEFTDYFFGTYKADDAFKAIDKDKDMVLSFSELVDQAAECCVTGDNVVRAKARAFAARVMRQLDVNLDGVLFVREYRRASTTT